MDEKDIVVRSEKDGSIYVLGADGFMAMRSADGEWTEDTPTAQELMDDYSDVPPKEASTLSQEARASLGV